MSSPATPNPRRWWALALLSVAQFLVILDTSIVGVALAEDRRGARLLELEPAVGLQRLCDRLRRAAPAGRPPRRSARRAPRLCRRLHPPRRRLSAGGSGDLGGDPD